MSATIAALFTKEPDWMQPPSDTPMGVRSLLERCLEKDPESRLGDISEAPMAIRCCMSCRAGAWPLIKGPTPAAAPFKSSRLGPLMLTAAVLTAAVTVSIAGWRWARSPAALPLVRLSAELGAGAVPSTGSGGPDPILSPDGTRIVFLTAGADGKQRLSARKLEEDHATELAGTENAHDPFFSPDSASVAFFADGKLKKLSLRGGLPVDVCDALDSRGGAWGQDGTSSSLRAPGVACSGYRQTAGGCSR